ncbi:hypothetical protein K8I85_07375, partial [bacterium]|nr:hypothetical protein [bacterium]
MTAHTSLRVGLAAVALTFLATSAAALPRATAEWRSSEQPGHAEGMPRNVRSQGGTTWIHVGDTDCTAADTIGSTHGPDEVWCFEGAGGDSSWPAVPGNPWR